MSKSQFILGMILASVFGGLVALGTFKMINKNKVAAYSSPSFSSFDSIHHTSGIANYLADTNISVPGGLNFVVAAKLVLS